VLLARSAEALAVVAAEIGDAAHAIAVDVADPAAVREAFAQIGQHHAHVDLLVNNAGAGAPSTLEELSDEQLHAEVATNFLGPLYCTRAALPMLRAGGGGDVVNISSAAVLNPYPMMWLYSAAKSALELASTALAQELRPDGVRVSVLRVGSIAGTGFQEGWSETSKERAFAMADEEGRERFAGGAPVEPALLAGWVVELAALPREVRVGLIDVRPS
jgi:NADP-dependent 3-hydroxy acid dehydrogenase YdfG